MPILRTRRARLLAATAAAIALAGAALTGCAPSVSAKSGTSDILRVANIGNASFTQNFNPFSPNALGMTNRAIYEPMLVTNLAKGEMVPWLAKDYSWSSDGLALTFTLKDGVQWSDGQPMTADDVAYTFDLAKKILGESSFSYVANVVPIDKKKVEFDLNRAYSPGLSEIGQQAIVPKHIWEKIDDPAKYQNTKPVGSGPFTEVANFSAQSYDLLKNKNYWQKDKKLFTGIRVVNYPGNDAATLAGINGDIDWGLGFIQDIDKTYVAKDPKHRGYWFPAVGSTISLALNTTTAPFDDPEFRKGVSMALDRKEIVAKGMDGYAEPADCTGLNGSQKPWRDDAVTSSCDWTTFDVEKAKARLEAAGYHLNSQGQRLDKSGKPIEFTMGVGSASTDWIAVIQIISRQLKAVGITATPKVQDWSQINQALFNGEFQGNIAWSNGGITPYEFYRGQMGCDTVKPVGEAATTNFQRVCSQEADQLLAQFAAAVDEKQQKSIMAKLEQLHVDIAPTIPLFPGPNWGTYNSIRFSGWPSKDDPYATLSASDPSAVIVMTTLKPVAG